MRTDDLPIRISLFAPNGRMGKAIAAAAAEDAGFEIDADHGDVLVDFSAPSALQASLDRATRTGSIEAGKDADIIAVATSPLEDVTVLERVRFVMRQGVVHELDGARQAFPPR